MTDDVRNSQLSPDGSPLADLVNRLGSQPVIQSARTVGERAFWVEGSGVSTLLVSAELAGDAAGAAAAVPVGSVGSAGAGPAAASPVLTGSVSEVSGWRVTRAPVTPENLAALRGLVPNLRPQPLGLTTSAGFGDRLGVATPGHVDAMRAAGVAGEIAPIFAQQSMRENARTGRTVQEVMDDATLGAFLAGWQGPVGADADHLKSEADIDLCLGAGYTFFTIDPGEHVNSAADDMSGAALQQAFEALPWDALDSSPDDLRARLSASSLDLGYRSLAFGPGELERAAVKYGGAVAHVTRLFRHLTATAAHAVELEVSVDETATPTSLAEHLYLAHEMKRLGVTWVSLAPRFVGAFEKGVEYIGDLAALALDLKGHAAIARELGPYKLSLHSGSDKFTVYPIAAQAAGGAVHLKTAGTSYLEALRVVGAYEPELLRAVTELGIQRFSEDVKTYHISGSPQGMPDLAALDGSALAALLEQVDARQVLHVTFGSALKAHGADLLRVLREHEDAYRGALRRHFERHLVPFKGHTSGGAL